MKVVSFKICPFVQRVTALLSVKKIKYDIEYIDLNQKPEWFIKISPNDQVPILITEDGDALFESDAIIEYIEEVAPPVLFNSNPVIKAQERAWSYLATKNYLTQCGAQRSDSIDALQKNSDKLNKAFATLDKKLSNSQYFNGSSLGMVDIAWLPLLHRAAIIEKHAGYDFIGAFKKVKALQKNILATAIPQKSVSDDFEEKFNAFYLSENTYLGQRVKFQKTCRDKYANSNFACC